MAYNPGYVDGVLVANNAAYVPGLGLQKVFDNVESGITYWIYVTADSLAAVQASGYITDATFKRLKVGDIVDVFTGTLVSETPAAAAGAKLGYAAFPATLGVLGMFTGVPTYQRMIVSSVTVSTNPAVSGVGTLQAVEPNLLALSANPRNMLDGGDFTTNPWQSGTSFNGTGTTVKVTADRFLANAGTSLVWNASQQADTSVQGFSTALQWGRSAGDTHTTGLTIGQVLETSDAIRCQGLPITLSWYGAAGANYAAGASGGILTATIYAGTGVNDTFANMVTGGWTGSTVVASAAYTPGLSPAVRFNPLSGTVPINCTQLGVAWSYQPTTAATSPGITAGANEWVRFIGTQLEIGAMTAFEHLDVAEVVNICTRYLQVISEPTTGMAIGPAAFSASTIAQVHIPLPSPMRKAPTVTFNTGGWAITDSALGAHRVSAGGLAVANTGALTLNLTCAATLTAGQVSFLQGQSTALGSIVLDADYY